MTRWFGIQKSPFVVSDDPLVRHSEVSLRRLRRSFGSASTSFPLSSPTIQLSRPDNDDVSYPDSTTTKPTIPTRQRRSQLSRPDNDDVSNPDSTTTKPTIYADKTHV
ncbi:hypothetical protein F2Q69_00019833 [Brassica cretica]|uniref:Uncharacterized protein n=1 Tax=Brassica cretica TaxID=69181 RepID=A0A8S9Q9E7_BRACR|nr:hypothetical protein F2Q69_00019833 [Brassica cretica]